VGHVGFTTHAPPEVAIQVLQTGEFCSVTGRFHYLDPVYQPLREKACQMGLGFIAMTPLGQGWLARPSAALRNALGEHDPVDFALRWIAAQRGVSSAIVGLSNLAELEAAHAAIGGEFDNRGPIVELADRLRAHVAEALGTEYCTGCGKCLPCPEDINIPELLRLNGLLRVYDLEEWCRDRYKFMGNAGTWYPGVKADHCTRCGLCEPRCPEGVPIVRLLEALHRDLFAGERGRLSSED
jgi:predicted aldo/keto reductase-like oxidoreductase